ncbi:MAG: hypothetical protein HY235_17900 [Acidobacteria bacterium]|nr:hypothetical protein [Acidobacteriota bacterium]
MWKTLAGRRMQMQLVLICITGLLIAALSVFLISDAVRGAEQIVLGDAVKAVDAAVEELSAQEADRAEQEADWNGLALELKDVSLRGVSQAVLRSYPGVEGGYWWNSEFLGYAFPTHINPEQKTDVPAAESNEIRAAAEESRRIASARRIVRGSGEAVVIAVRYHDNTDMAAWAMKRVSGLGDARQQRRRLWLAALVSAALLSLMATLATAAGLERGVSRIKQGLAVLERDYQHRIPETLDELGHIARAINQMVVRREALEKELRREDRLRAMGRLVAAVAHEVRNPLNGMRLAAQLLKKQMAQDRPDGRQLDSIISEIDRLEALVREFLAFDSDRPPSMAFQPLRPTVARAVKLVDSQAARLGITITMDEQGGEASACFDEGHLTQVLLNLLLNAIESQGSGGWVRVEIGGGNRAEIRVTDSGPAIPPDEQERLFEMFYSNKPNGAGLGLAVSRELIRQMGGDLTYDTHQENASFLVRMPRANHGE